MLLKYFIVQIRGKTATNKNVPTMEMQ